MKRVAVLTDATSPGFFFPLWHRVYAEAFGPPALHVLTYQGQRDAFAAFPLGNLWALNASYDDTLRAAVISDLVALLLRTHDVVVRVDVDEFLLPDLRLFTGLGDFIERHEAPFATAQGIDVLEMPGDAPLDLDAPVFGGQRRFGVRSTALNKTCVTSIPLRWAEGFHGASAPPALAPLYLLHLKFADLSRRVGWHELMQAASRPDSKAASYFSVGAAHLAGVQAGLAAKPVGDDGDAAAFNARFLASVGQDPAKGTWQGAFLYADTLLRLDTPPFRPPADLAAGRKLRALGTQALDPGVAVDLGAARRIGRVSLRGLQASAPGLALFGSADGVSWELRAVRLEGEAPAHDFHPKPFTARHLLVGLIGPGTLALAGLSAYPP